jgi:hypothetical protein
MTRPLPLGQFQSRLHLTLGGRYPSKAAQAGTSLILTLCREKTETRSISVRNPSNSAVENYRSVTVQPFGTFAVSLQPGEPPAPSFGYWTGAASH